MSFSPFLSGLGKLRGFRRIKVLGRVPGPERNQTGFRRRNLEFVLNHLDHVSALQVRIVGGVVAVVLVEDVGNVESVGDHSILVLAGVGEHSPYQGHAGAQET